KCVGLARLCTQTALSQPCQSLGSWVRGHRQQMFSGAQYTLVTFIKPDNCNLDAVDGQVDGLACPKLRCPVHNQVSIVGTGRRRIGSELARLNWRTSSKAPRNRNDD